MVNIPKSNMTATTGQLKHILMTCLADNHVIYLVYMAQWLRKFLYCD